jgi:hypothetical protein
METEYLLSWSQETGTGLYPDPGKSSPCLHTLFIYDQF